MSLERSNEVKIKMPLLENFAGSRREVHHSARFAIERTAQFLSLHEITLRIVDDPKKVIPGHAHAGYSHSAERISIYIDPRFPGREKLLYIELPRSVSHELHHAVRRKELPGDPESLGAALIMEGLAVSFETEVWGGEPSLWATAISLSDIQSLLPIIVDEWNSKKYDHARWFYGKGDLPRWAGYAVGAYLVAEYLKRHPGETAASLVGTPTQTFYEEAFPRVINPTTPSSS